MQFQYTMLLNKPDSIMWHPNGLRNLFGVPQGAETPKWEQRKARTTSI